MTVNSFTADSLRLLAWQSPGAPYASNAALGDAALPSNEWMAPPALAQPPAPPVPPDAPPPLGAPPALPQDTYNIIPSTSAASASMLALPPAEGQILPASAPIVPKQPNVMPASAPISVDYSGVFATLLNGVNDELVRLRVALDALLVKANRISNAPSGTRPTPSRPPQPAPKPVARPVKPKPTPPSKRDFFATREKWFICQYPSDQYNPNEDTPHNGNCGPTSLTMVAEAFGKIRVTPAQADRAIEESRRRMDDSQDQNEGTSAEGVARGARTYGLDAKIIEGISLSDIRKELEKGRLVIINGNYIRSDESMGGGHFYVVTKIDGDKAYLNDPAWGDGPRVVSTDALMESVNTHFGKRMISVGKGK